MTSRRAILYSLSLALLSQAAFVLLYNITPRAEPGSPPLANPGLHAAAVQFMRGASFPANYIPAPYYPPMPAWAIWTVVVTLNAAFWFGVFYLFVASVRRWRGSTQGSASDAAA